MAAVIGDDDDVVPVDYARDPGRTGPEIHAALSEENQARFEAKWRVVIDHAARTYDLRPAEELLVQWRGVAALDLTPELVADVQRTMRRIAAGKETFVNWHPDDVTTAEDDLAPDDAAEDGARTGPEIYAALSDPDRVEFTAGWQVAIDHASATYDLEPAEALLERWRRVRSDEGEA